MMRGVRRGAVADRRRVLEAAAAEAEPAPEPVLVGTGGEAAAPSPALAVVPDPEPLGEIEVKTFPMTSVLKRHRWLRIPILRGVVALGESLAIGFKALNISANAQLGDEDEEIGGGMWFGTVVVALIFAIGLFFVVPVGLTSLIQDQLGS